MASRSRELLNRAAEADDLASLLKQGIGGAMLAVATGLITGILTLADLVILPVQALGEGIAGTVDGFIGGIGLILGAGAEATARSLLGAFNVGPFTFALGLASVLLALWLLRQYLQEPETGNLIPGLPDIPFFGTEEEGEDNGF